MINFTGNDRVNIRDTMNAAFNRLIRAHAEVYCLAVAIVSIAALAVIH